MPSSEFDEFDEFESAEDSISSSLQQLDRSPKQIAEELLNKLSNYGVSDNTAATLKSTPTIAGAISGLGYALTHEGIQQYLFPPVTKMIANAGSGLRVLLIVQFLEPYLRGPLDLSDPGSLEYMRWFLKLKDTPSTKWAVDEAYELYPEGRMESDVRRVLQA